MRMRSMPRAVSPFWHGLPSVPPGPTERSPAFHPLHVIGVKAARFDVAAGRLLQGRKVTFLDNLRPPWCTDRTARNGERGVFLTREVASHGPVPLPYLRHGSDTLAWRDRAS